MRFRLATWNINSVRLRVPLIARFVAEFAPDILCLQEIKCRDEDFPVEAIKALGFPYLEVNGQSGYHGVATASRLPITRLFAHSFCGTTDARHLAVGFSVNGLDPFIIHNLYVPAGGDIPDPELNPKFRQKLAFLSQLAAWFAKPANRAPHMLLAGDFNVAPLENDVWSHKQLLDVVSHTPIEVEHLARAQAALGWIDPVRIEYPPEQKLYTWWSYRARDWRASNRGRRLDHIWTTPAVAAAVRKINIPYDARGWEQPSDHVPVIADFVFE